MVASDPIEMKQIRIAIPAGWRDEPRGAERHLHVAGGVTVGLSPVQPLPDDPVAWIRATLADARVLRGGEVVLPSGWPAFVYEAERAGERALVVLWRFLEWAAVATCRAEASLFDQHKGAILDVLGGATIDWGEPPLVSLAQIWDGFSRT